jgi:hypothetical protein
MNIINFPLYGFIMLFYSYQQPLHTQPVLLLLTNIS